MNNTTSEERLAANRANAQKSTGPKTLEGRAASRMNALKHGLLSQEVLICSPHRYESEAELFALHDRFRNELQPMGPIEQMLADQIVTTHWRLRRVLAAESAEMTLSLRRGRSQCGRQFEPETTQLETETYEDGLPLDESAAGCREAQRRLREIVKAVRRKGALTSDILDHECSFLGSQLNILGELQELLQRRVENPDGVKATAWKEQHLTEVLDYLDNKIREMTLLEAEHYAAALMPSAEVLEKFGRYETMLNRQLHRAMTQLAKLQKERRKEEKADLFRDDPFWKQTKLPTPKVSYPKPEDRQREILRNEAIAQMAAAQNSEFDDPSSEELRNEANPSPEEENLPNEPILASHPSQISHLRAQTTGNSPNEATVAAGNEEPLMKHG